MLYATDVYRRWTIINIDDWYKIGKNGFWNYELETKVHFFVKCSWFFYVDSDAVTEVIICWKWLSDSQTAGEVETSVNFHLASLWERRRMTPLHDATFL
jgi:hypothetical protein